MDDFDSMSDFSAIQGLAVVSLTNALIRRGIPAGVVCIAVHDAWNVQALREGDSEEYLRRVNNTLRDLLP